MELKLVISDPKTGKSVQRELKDEAALALKRKKIGETFKGESIDLTGYEFKITGGSDAAGFPMRKDVPGTGRARILAVKGIGLSNKKKSRGKDMKYMRKMKGMRQRKTVAGGTIGEKTAQVNVMIIKAGKENLFAEAPKEVPAGAEAKPAEEAKPEAKEGKKEEQKKEEPKQEKAEEKKVPEKKQEKPEKENKEEKTEKPKPEEKPAEAKKKEPKAEKEAPEKKEEKTEEKKETPKPEEKPKEPEKK